MLVMSYRWVELGHLKRLKYQLVDAARVLYVVNMATSIPTFCKVVLNHRAILDLLSIMCGLVKRINRAVRFRSSSPESS